MKRPHGGFGRREMAHRGLATALVGCSAALPPGHCPWPLADAGTSAKCHRTQCLGPGSHGVACVVVLLDVAAGAWRCFAGRTFARACGGGRDGISRGAACFLGARPAGTGEAANRHNLPGPLPTSRRPRLTADANPASAAPLSPTHPRSCLSAAGAPSTAGVRRSRRTPPAGPSARSGRARWPRPAPAGPWEGRVARRCVCKLHCCAAWLCPSPRRASSAVHGWKLNQGLACRPVRHNSPSPPVHLHRSAAPPAGPPSPTHPEVVDDVIPVHVGLPHAHVVLEHDRLEHRHR